MKHRITKYLLLLMLAIVLFFPFSGKVQHFLGNEYLVLIFPLEITGVFILYFLYKETPSTFSIQRTLLALTSLLVILLVLFITIFPKANTGQFGPGSDRDEALNLTVNEIKHCRYPYYITTETTNSKGERVKIGNPISPLPGALLFAAPFVLMGNSAYQNFFWITALFFTLTLFLSWKDSLFLSILLTLGSGITLHEFVTGGDLFSNSTWIVLISLLFINSIKQEKAAYLSLALALLLGIGLSSRPNFIFSALPVLGYTIFRIGIKKTLPFAITTIISLGAITLPFYLYDPQGFSPLHTWGKINNYQSIFPYSGIIITSFTALAAILSLLLPPMHKTVTRLLYSMALIQSIPVISITLLASFSQGRLDLDSTAWYGINFMVPMVIALGFHFTERFGTKNNVKDISRPVNRNINNKRNSKTMLSKNLIYLKASIQKVIKPRSKASFISGLPMNSSLLDVGCGNNSPLFTSILRPDIHYTGIDVGDYNQAEYSKEAAQSYLIVPPEDFSKTIFSYKNEFDSVISSHNIEHCDEPRDVLSGMISALKAGGMLYMAFPSESSITFPSRKGTLNFYDDKTHRHIIQFDDIVQRLEDLGMSITFKSKRYRPAFLFLIGLIFEPFSYFLGRVIPGGATWAFYGFESIIYAKKKE